MRTIKKAKAAIFTGTDEVMQLKEISIPELFNGQILVKNQYTTLCRSDLNTYSGKRNEKTPTILGHEIVGTIAEFANGMPTQDLAGNDLKIGDRITWAIYASDPEDALSKRGIPQKAADLFKYGHEEIAGSKTLHGGLAEYTILRQNTPVLKLKEEVPNGIAALINCSVATVAGGIRLAGDIKNRHVLVSGAGMLGVMACAMAKTMGAKTVSAMDINDDRLNIALDFGADYLFDLKEDWEEHMMRHLGNPKPFDVALEFSGAASAMENTLRLLGIGGTAIWIGGTFPQRDLQLNSEYLIRNILTVKGLHNYNETDFKNAVDFIGTYHDHFPFSQLVEDYCTLNEVNEAFEHGLNSNAFRVGISIKH
ncbi:MULTISPECIES: zinc-binding dehydrogenase [Flavobacteriaceae]|uniref:zinc-binding dehydrogenase n=1 Tax=Flavobacteriaceae TaxID=49546 RepID=UPI00149103F0|nr:MULTISPECIES: zinc-binding dehydrogenase [Allomuricauda]MDC6367640.1 zinc-binding dehydrogenase [Muricauda sp. AC10]